MLLDYCVCLISVGKWFYSYTYTKILVESFNLILPPQIHFYFIDMCLRYYVIAYILSLLILKCIVFCIYLTNK